MTKDEVRVLGYVGANLGGPERIKESLRATYRDLMERGFIERIDVYQLTKTGEQAMTDAEELPDLASVQSS